MSEGSNATQALLAQAAKDHHLLEVLIGNTDAFFLIIIGIIIFFMQGGFAFLEAGSVRFGID